MELQKMNKQRLDDIKYMGMSHGLEVLISQIQKAQQFNREPRWTRRAGEEYRREIVNVYFSWVTDNRLMAHIIVENELLRYRKLAIDYTRTIKMDIKPMVEGITSPIISWTIWYIKPKNT